MCAYNQLVLRFPIRVSTTVGEREFVGEPFRWVQELVMWEEDDNVVEDAAVG